MALFVRNPETQSTIWTLPQMIWIDMLHQRSESHREWHCIAFWPLSKTLPNKTTHTLVVSIGLGQLRDLVHFVWVVHAIEFEETPLQQGLLVLQLRCRHTRVTFDAVWRRQELLQTTREANDRGVQTEGCCIDEARR
jgi:hypothetical protein